MTKLDRFMIEPQQVTSPNDVLSIIEREETNGNGHVQPGDVCRHVDFADFRCKVISVDDGRARVKILDGWRGPSLPKEPVPVPTVKLEVLQ